MSDTPFTAGTLQIRKLMREAKKVKTEKRRAKDKLHLSKQREAREEFLLFWAQRGKLVFSGQIKIHTM